MKPEIKAAMRRCELARQVRDAAKEQYQQTTEELASLCEYKPGQVIDNITGRFGIFKGKSIVVERVDASIIIGVWYWVAHGRVLKKGLVPSNYRAQHMMEIK